ncbi:uncharacterized protein LOC109835624 [Asparagus officinalis]|uniref:uncharacterized protein LOC109835624 n=1 Tax=Asparagus officinalis TaxID=4686 RepID=UPI00098E4731|nr:uncharacterized protein LOC109835624 [Asparagus officinalis]
MAPKVKRVASKKRKEPSSSGAAEASAAEDRGEVPTAEEPAAEPILISDDDSEGRATPVASDPAPEPGDEPCLEIPPITALAPGQEPAPSESLSWQARIEEFESAAYAGAVEKVISIPSDEEEGAGNEEGFIGSADPAHEVVGKEDPPSWTGRSPEEVGGSEEDDDVSVHEALSSEKEVRAREDAPSQIGGSPAPEEASTVMTTGTSTAISSTVEEAALSPLERERKRSAARSVADFQDTLAGCIKLALEESCPFESFEEDLDYIVKAEDERVSLEQQKADNRVSRLSLEVENLKQVIAKAQASLAIQEKAREEAAKELESIESHRTLTANSIEEKDRAYREVKETVQDLASRTEEDLRQEILRRLEHRHAREIREAELRLKAL